MWSRGGPNAVRRSFSRAASARRGAPQPSALLLELQTTAVRLRRLTALRNRLDRDRARADTRQSVQDRRARTRHLIELGGLVQKAGLVELVEDDRATLLGAFLELAARLQEDERQEEKPIELKARWRRRGLRAFDAERDDAPEAPGAAGGP
jgi:hypothetical protein